MYYLCNCYCAIIFFQEIGSDHLPIVAEFAFTESVEDDSDEDDESEQDDESE